MERASRFQLYAGEALRCADYSRTMTGAGNVYVAKGDEVFVDVSDPYVVLFRCRPCNTRAGLTPELVQHPDQAALPTANPEEVPQ